MRDASLRIGNDIMVGSCVSIADHGINSGHSLLTIYLLPGPVTLLFGLQPDLYYQLLYYREATRNL